ncbi:MAG: SDR family NAD(P)-dependent oxidoreductase [Phycisphaerales bacterium]|nr:SDR family NAD(P)-dependent oxidoreductase [Phycisphaerales bacterium]
MAIDLKGLPIAITGASSGIGLYAALACARAGMPVTVAARRADRLAEVVDRIRGEGGRAVAVECDVTDPVQCRAITDRTIAEFGSIYAVFANAGYGLEKPFLGMSDAEIRAIFETNYFGTINTIRPALDAMLSAGRGHVLVCSSCLSKIGLPLYSAYCATKAAQDDLSRALRHELRFAGHGDVHVSSVHPIGTRTELFETKKFLSGGQSKVLPPDSQRRLQSPEVVARAIVRCLRRPRGEVWTSLPTRLAMAAALAMPGLADWGIGLAVGSRLRKSEGG